MKTSIFGLAAILCATQPAPASVQVAAPSSAVAPAAQELLQISRAKWAWMAERNIAALDRLFHPKAKFVHMGATMSKAQELNVIRTGRIQYKKADIESASVELIGDTAIVLNKIRLIAVVGGNEVTNPFVVTEVYVRESRNWHLASMSFTRLLGS